LTSKAGDRRETVSRPILIRGAKQLLTLRGAKGVRRGLALQELGIIADGAVLIRDGIIDQVGPTRRVENLAASRSALEFDATGRVVMPGFVDSHTHLISGPPWLDEYERRIEGGNPVAARRGLRASVQAIRSVSGARLELIAKDAIQTMLRHGTTTLEAKSGYGYDLTGEFKLLRALAALAGQPADIVPTFLASFAIPFEFGEDPERYVSRVISELLPKLQRRKLCRFVEVACENPGPVLNEARRLLEAARDKGFALKVQADQFRPTGGVGLAVELGARSAAHLEHIDDTGIAALGQSETIATLVPGSAFHLGLDRYAPARRLIEAGAAVALATGMNPDSSPTSSMQMVLSLACARMRMMPAEAITAATINAAYALGCGSSAGSLEVGKWADLIVLNVSDYREIPYQFGVNHAHFVIKRGRLVYREAAVSAPPG